MNKNKKLRRHTVRTRQIMREVIRLRNKQRRLRKTWLEHDIKINAYIYQIDDILSKLKPIKCLMIKK